MARLAFCLSWVIAHPRLQNSAANQGGEGTQARYRAGNSDVTLTGQWEAPKLFESFFHWLSWELGKGKAPDSESWSQLVHESFNYWNILEGTHLMTVGLFFGTILVVDLRMLGLMFKKTPLSEISDRTLPLTVVGFLTLVITGVLVFMSKPEEYYHNLMFRTKMLAILIAMINIAVFHFKVQKTQTSWDKAENPPLAAKLSASISLICWLLVISCGRLIAYNFFDCGKPLPAYINALEECASSQAGVATLETK